VNLFGVLGIRAILCFEDASGCCQLLHSESGKSLKPLNTARLCVCHDVPV